MTDIVKASFSAHRARIGLALVRLLLLYAAVWLLMAHLSPQMQLLSQNAPELSAQPVSGTGIPFSGINVALEQTDAPHRRQTLKDLSEAGFKWVRWRVNWADIEPAPGDFRWARIDRVLQDVADSGLVPVVVLYGSPEWARLAQDRAPTANPYAPPGNPADFARFAQEFSRRYREQVRYYQIWDEPNVAPNWGNRLIDPVGYARLLHEASVAIRGAAPDAVIVLGALAPTGDRGHTAIDEVYFLERLYAAGAADDFDVVAIQPFGFAYPPEDARQDLQLLNFQRARLVHRAMAAAGDGATPVWAVRFGWNRIPNPVWRAVTPEEQARYAVNAIRLARREWPWMEAMAWAIDRPAAPASDPLWGFALAAPDGGGDLLLHAFQQANRAIDSPQARPAFSPGAGATTPRLSAVLARIAAILAALGLAGWRIIRIARGLPWNTWKRRYLALGPTWHVAGWLGLLGVYYFATWPPLIVACWILAGLWMAARPVAGLMLIGLLLPFHIFHKEVELLGRVWTVPPAQAALLCLLPALLANLRAGWKDPSTALRRVRRAEPMDWLAVGWLALNLAAAGNVWHWPGYASGLWSVGVAPLLTYLAVRFLARSPVERQLATAAILAGGVLAASVGLLDWLQGGGVVADGVRRLAGVSFSPNQVALLLERVFFVGLSLALASRQRNARVGALAGSAAVLLAIGLTQSRGALLLGLPAGAISFIWLAWPAPRRRFSLRWTRAIVYSSFGVVGVGASEVLGGLGNRIWNSESVLQRLYVWQGSLELWRSFPLLGVGPGGFFWRYPAYMAPEAANEPNLLHPHNVWLEFLTFWGIAGLAWLAAMFIILARKTVAIRRADGRERLLAAGLTAGLVAGLAHGQVDAFTALPELAAWNWLALGLLARMALPHAGAD